VAVKIQAGAPRHLPPWGSSEENVGIKEPRSAIYCILASNSVQSIDY